jgi:hypothetical protein
MLTNGMASSLFPEVSEGAGSRPHAIIHGVTLSAIPHHYYELECRLDLVILNAVKNLKNSTWHYVQHLRFFTAFRVTGRSLGAENRLHFVGDLLSRTMGTWAHVQGPSGVMSYEL